MRRRILLALVSIVVTASTARAAEYEHTLAVYFLGAGMDGTAGIGSLEADVDVSFSDILENLEFGAMAAYRVDRGKWAMTSDFIYMGLGVTKDGSRGLAKADAEFDQWMVELDGVYKQSERFEALFGLRYNRLDGEVVLTPVIGAPLAAAGDQDWIDPLVGVRWIQPLGKRFDFIARADVGGFGVGSDFAWQALARFDWRVSGTFGVTFGYRILDVEYDDGDGASRFLYDVTTQGPVAGMTFSF